MSFIWNLISKAKITEEMLKENSIEILDNSKLIKNLNNEPLVITGFGKFYKGIYGDKEITYKFVDITLNENIINEFILWKKYQNYSNSFLIIKGVILNYNSAYIIFEDCLKYTLQSLLLSQKKKPLNENQKINIAKQILEIINIIQKDKEINTDLRPGTLIINSEQKVKLIDFGYMTKLPEFINKEEVKQMQIKYSPPEYLLENKIDYSYDIYSFGCILIDLFSNDLNKTILKKSYENYDDYINDILNEQYPIIPDDINYLLKEIIKKCVDKNSNQRIKINELYHNLNVILDNMKYFNTKNNLNIDKEFKNEDLVENEEFIRLKNLYNYSKELNIESIKYESIENDLKQKIEKMKKDLNNIYKNNLHELDKLKNKLKTKIDEVIDQNKEIINLFYNKTLDNIIYFINLLGCSMVDIDEIKRNAPEMQLLLLSYNKFINKNKYENVEEIINSWKNDMDKRIKKYSNNKYFDIIDISFDKCKKFVNKNEELANNYFIELNKLYENITNMKGFFGNDNKIEKELDDQLLVQKLINGFEIENKIKEEKQEIEPNKNVMTNIIYAKIVENSNMLSIFNYDNKELKNYIITDEKYKNFRFNSNCFSLYDSDKNYIYISGGIKDIKDPDSHDNSLFRLDIIEKDKENKMKYEFKINKLKDMNNKRSYHTMLNLSDDKNTILCISGINTESCEVYNIEYDQWESIQELPTKCQSPGIIDYNKYIYVFPYSKDYMNIYRMNMDNGEFMWESIKYSINEGSIKKGMIIIPKENELLLLGGYDNNGNYSHIYQVELNNDNNENKIIYINLSVDLSLPNDIYFTSNYVEFDINKENKKENTILIMDNFNGVLEFNIDSCKFKYYLGQ